MRAILRGILASALLLSSRPVLAQASAVGGASADAGNAVAHTRFVGVYISHGGKTDPSMSVSLGGDGTATVVEDPGNGAITLFGHWTDSGSQITVEFYPADGKPAAPPMAFESSRDGLQAVAWNHAIWGKVTPPPMKKGSKVKSKYWFTTVR